MMRQMIQVWLRTNEENKNKNKDRNNFADNGYVYELHTSVCGFHREDTKGLFLTFKWHESLLFFYEFLSLFSM
jgi:hypothetical protein